ENRGDIRVTNARRRACFAQKTKPRRFVTEISLTDNFQCHRAVQIDVQRLVSDPHRTATQFDWFAVFTRHQLVVLKSLHRLFRCRRLDRVPGSKRPARLNPAAKTLAKHADRTEFHCSGELIATAWALASALRFHAPNRPSDAECPGPSASGPWSLSKKNP